MVTNTNDCGFCGASTRMQYPGNDPENGYARRMCKAGHSQCEGCDTWLEDAGHCEACVDRHYAECKDPNCPSCVCMYCSQRGESCTCPVPCALCGHDVQHGEGEMRTVDLDPGDAEVGPQPQVEDHMCHKTCPTGPKAWEERW